MRIKKSVVFFFGVFLLLLTGLPIESSAGVNVNVGINIPLPPFRFHAPPPVFVIPGTYIYAVPDVDVEIFFHQGYWYRPYESHWYRSKSYNGPWAWLDSNRVPRTLFDLPPDYRRIPPGHQKIPYGQFKKNWGRWERERYWERDERWREGRHERRGRDFDHAGPPSPHGPPGPPLPPPPPGPPDRMDHRGHGPHGR